MKFTKLRIGLIVGGILGVIGLGYAFSCPSETQTFVTDTVKRGALAQTVEVTGELQSVSDLSLAFETSGTIAVVSVDEGDSVRAGDVLAELGNVELGAQAEQARQSVVAAQAELDLRLTGISSEAEAAERAGVAVADAQVASALADLNAAFIAQSTGSAQDAATVTSVQSDYDQVAAQNAEATEQAAETLAAALHTALIRIRAGLQSADQVLGVENTILNIEIDQYVGLLDPNTLNDSREAFLQAADARDEAEDLVIALTSTSSEADVLAAYTKTATALSLVSNTLLYTSRVLDASVSDSGSFSNADLITLRAAIATERASVSASTSALLSAKQAHDTAIRLADDRLTDATNALALAIAQQNAGEASRAANVAKANASLAVFTAQQAQAQALLASVLADPRDIDVAGLRATVARAEAEYRAALARLRKSQIVAPIDGVVTTVAFSVGEQVSAGQAMIGQIALDDAYEITLDVPEAEISKLAVAQRADITFDAFGDRVVFTGSVYSVSPSAKIISDVVYYEAKVILSDDQDLSSVKPGMSADVTIHTDERTDVLYVPNRAILLRDNTLYVRVPKNENEFDAVNVTVGLRADDGFTEIVSGVTEGQAIILSVKTE